MEQNKKCIECGEDKDVSEFHTSGIKNGKRYYRRKCRDCYRCVKQAYRDRKLSWFREYKDTLACEQCGYSKDTHERFTHKALDFHHHNDDKLFNVSDGPYLGYSKDKILNEINKCMVLCSVCHAEKHTK
jgi:hypothetical protein